MNDKLKQFFGNGKQAGATLAGFFAATYVLYGQITGKKLVDINWDNVAKWIAMLAPLIAAYGARAAGLRAATAADSKAAINKDTIESLKQDLGNATVAIQTIASATGTSLNVPVYTPGATRTLSALIENNTPKGN